MNLCFGDIVVIENDLIGVIVKSWNNDSSGISHDVYVRSFNKIVNYPESDINRYMVRHKQLNEEELCYQSNAINQ